MRLKKMKVGKKRMPRRRMGVKKCPVVVDGKECGRELTPEKTTAEDQLVTFVCPLGHVSHFGPAPLTKEHPRV